MTKILILGARGMLGSDISSAFSSYNPILLDKEDLDLLDFETVNKTIKNISPEIIINCSGYTDVDKAEDNEEFANNLNAYAVENLAKICKEINCIFLQFSTEYIFDGENKNDYEENAISNSKNAYGRSKALGEKLLQENLENYYIIRTSWLYGKNPQLGKERGINFVDRIIELASTRDELNMVNDQFSKPTYTKDLAEGVKKIIEKKYTYGIYHVVNEDSATPYEFAKEIFKIKNINTKLNPISYSAYPSKVNRPINALLINTKFPPLRSWQEAIQDYLK